MDHPSRIVDRGSRRDHPAASLSPRVVLGAFPLGGLVIVACLAGCWDVRQWDAEAWALSHPDADAGEVAARDGGGGEASADGGATDATRDGGTQDGAAVDTAQDAGADTAAPACQPNRADCDGNPSNGCEVDLTRLENCDRCGHACIMREAYGSCVPSRGCVIQRCAAGWNDCDGNPDNGCEVETGDAGCGATPGG